MVDGSSIPHPRPFLVDDVHYKVKQSAVEHPQWASGVVRRKENSRDHQKGLSGLAPEPGLLASPPRPACQYSHGAQVSDQPTGDDTRLSARAETVISALTKAARTASGLGYGQPGVGAARKTVIATLAVAARATADLLHREASPRGGIAVVAALAVTARAAAPFHERLWLQRPRSADGDHHHEPDEEQR